MAFTNQELVDELVKSGYLKTPQLVEAFLKIDRADFVPENLKSEAYINAPLPIGWGQTISQPLVVAFMLELLEPKLGENILEVGAGSGWQTALLAHLNGEITAIERVPELYEMARANVSEYEFLKDKAELILGDGSKGYKKKAPYDKIIAGAAAEKVPAAWKRELKVGGRIVAPVKSSIAVLDKIAADKFEKKEFFGFSFVPLIKGGAGY